MSRGETPHSLRTSAFRFVIAGGINTAVTALALALLSLVIDPRVAYTVVFVAGVVLSTVLADRFVFGVRMPAWAIAAYVAMYGAVYLVGLAVVAVLGQTGLPAWASSLVVLVTAPLTFVGGRLITSAAHRRRTAGTAGGEPGPAGLPTDVRTDS